MKKPSYVGILATCLLSFFFAAQQANAATFFLNQSNELADNVNYAQVDVTETAGNLHFNVKALDPTNWKFSNFYFNLGGSTGAVTLTNSIGWVSDSGNVSEFGSFSHGLKGNGGSLQSEFSFTADGANALSLSNLMANGEGWIFASHSQCQNKKASPCVAVGNQTSHHIAGPGEVSNVPVPAAVWLFGSAMAGLGTVGRRKKA